MSPLVLLESFELLPPLISSQKLQVFQASPVVQLESFEFPWFFLLIPAQKLQVFQASPVVGLEVFGIHQIVPLVFS